MTLLPYDFDQSGLVNAPYASVDPRLGIQRVTQRIYRGYCWHNNKIAEAIEIFNARRPEIEALFNREDLPNQPARRRALKFVDSFFEIINNPKKLEKWVLGACR
jgi:hypothetical protein